MFLWYFQFEFFNLNFALYHTSWYFGLLIHEKSASEMQILSIVPSFWKLVVAVGHSKFVSAIKSMYAPGFPVFGQPLVCSIKDDHCFLNHKVTSLTGLCEKLFHFSEKFLKRCFGLVFSSKVCFENFEQVHDSSEIVN